MNHIEQFAVALMGETLPWAVLAAVTLCFLRARNGDQSVIRTLTEHIVTLKNPEAQAAIMQLRMQRDEQKHRLGMLNKDQTLDDEDDWDGGELIGD